MAISKAVNLTENRFTAFSFSAISGKACQCQMLQLRKYTILESGITERARFARVTQNPLCGFGLL